MPVFKLSEERGFFDYVYHYAIKNSEVHFPKLQNYVALFGFIRTICLIFILYTWVLFLPFSLSLIKYLFSVNNEFPIYAMAILIIFSILSYVSYLGFMKFYRLFSLEALMAVSVTYKTETPTKKSTHNTYYKR